MILKVQLNLRLHADSNVSTSGEVIVDTPEQAKAAGREFLALVYALHEGIQEAAREDESGL